MSLSSLLPIINAYVVLILLIVGLHLVTAGGSLVNFHESKT